MGAAAQATAPKWSATKPSVERDLSNGLQENHRSKKEWVTTPSVEKYQTNQADLKESTSERLQWRGRKMSTKEMDGSMSLGCGCTCRPLQHAQHCTTESKMPSTAVSNAQAFISHMHAAGQAGLRSAGQQPSVVIG